MNTLMFLLLCVLVLRALGGSVRPGRSGGPAASWSAWSMRLAEDVLHGARTLSRLDAARRDRLGRPWS